MPFQAHKNNCARLRSKCLRMLQERVKHTWKYQHFHIPTPSPASIHPRAVASQQSPATCHQAATFQDPRLSRGSLLASPSLQLQASNLKRGSGGRRPNALKSGHRARRAQGMAVAKRYGGPLSLAAALLNPSQVNLFTQGFPPPAAHCRRPPFFCSAVAVSLLSTCRTGRHRRWLNDGKSKLINAIQGGNLK